MTPLLETQYLPSIAWCTGLWKASEAALDGAENYQKGFLRNRCYIAGPNGPQRLSIPLIKGKHQQTPIREVRIARDSTWQRQHWRSIKTAYGNAPYFDHYADAVAHFYIRKWNFLFEYNLAWMEWLLKQKLLWNGQLKVLETYIKPGEWTTGPDLRNEVSGHQDQWPQWFSPTPYPQVFEAKTGFVPNLSVIDLLFCCGKNGREILSPSAK